MIIMTKVIIVIIVLKKFKKILKISATLNDSKAKIYVPQIEVFFPEEFDP